MIRRNETKLSLESCRVLDLSEGGCTIGGRMLADLGADVIQIERPGGSPSRIGPYYKDIADPEKSLFWFAYNMNKRGISLDITRTEGRKIFERLVKTADIVIESFEVGFMGRLGLGYEDLCKIKPDIIVASITPFGQSGPKARYKGCDLTAWASGGYLYVCGDPDRPPNSDLYKDPQLAHRKYFVKLEHPEMGTPAYPQQADFILSKTPREVTRPSPCLGEHNE